MITPKPRSGGRPHNAVMQRLASDPAWMAQAKIDGWRARWRDGDCAAEQACCCTSAQH